MKTPKITLLSPVIDEKWREAECWYQECLYVSSLDPLGIDNAMKELPLLNKNRDTEGLIALLYKYLPTPDLLEYLNLPETLATMRDIGLFLGSLKRHGVEPIDAIPELEYVLEVLSEKTSLPPRDTLFHYTIWNPSGHRLRSYTGTPDELALIESVQIAMRPLMESIHHLTQLHEVSPDTPLYEEICNAASEAFTGVISGIVSAKRNVSPSVFANELRFYYDPIIWNKKQYFGPGAVEMPMFVFDHLLWSSETTDSIYKKFKTTYLQFNQPAVRDIYRQFDGKPSLVNKMLIALGEVNTLDTPSAMQIRKSGKTLLGLCNMMKSFRMPHKKLAEDAYKQQGEGHKQQGSGGYSTDILTHIITLNVATIDELETALHFNK